MPATANYWTLEFSNIHKDMDITFTNVRAHNEQQAINSCLANVAVQNHWVLRSVTNHATPLNVSCSRVAGR